MTSLAQVEVPLKNPMNGTEDGVGPWKSRRNKNLSIGAGVSVTTRSFVPHWVGAVQ